MAQQDGSIASVPTGPPANRPTLSSHHSSSVPSTPSQRAKRLSFNARSPSPTKMNGARSPTASSEANSGPNSQRKSPSFGGCKYEQGATQARRRIPYSLGGEVLERPKTMPKKYLSPKEEEKLSGDMRELYDRLLPSSASDERRSRFVQKLERILNERWPGNDIRVYVFGSSGNLLSIEESDVDICITTPLKALERVCLVAKALADYGMERVVCVPYAKVPIVKFWDPEIRLACDLNVNNSAALENTRLIKTYVQIDKRVRPLAMIIKHWTRRRILNDAAFGGTLSSYTWICMILNFLQTRNPPVLPCLHKRPHQCLKKNSGTSSAFADDVESLEGFGQKNKESLSELLFHFFRRYGHEIDYEKHIISVREGCLISKEEKGWHLTHNNRLCVEEPFNVGRNLGNTADDTSVRGVHLEIRRAFDLLAEAKLEECMEEYVFPPAEEKTWEKPPSKPIPVMSRSRSQSQSGRGGRGGHNRGHRFGHQYQHQHRNGPQGRRASSAAASQKHANLPGLLPSTPRDQHMQLQLDNLQLHDHLMNEYQLLQAREAELRYIQQAHMRSQLQAHNINGSKPLPNGLRRSSRDEPSSSAAMRQPPPTAPLHNGGIFPPFSYPIPMIPHPVIHTNPSSPSMKVAQPDLRRASHRASNIDSTANINSRSQSQPPRPLPYNLALQSQQIDLLNDGANQYYQQSRQQQDIAQALEAKNRAKTSVLPQTPFRMERAMDESSQYLGYYVHDFLPTQSHVQDPHAFRAHTHNDLQKWRGMQPGFSRFHDHSRSPSPSPAIPYRDRSMSTRSLASAPFSAVSMERDRLSSSGIRGSGPVIIDGSDGWEPTRTPSNGRHRPSFGHSDENFLDPHQPASQPSAMDFENQYQGGMHFGALPAESMRSRYAARPPREAQPHHHSPLFRSRDSSFASQYSKINGILPETMDSMMQVGPLDRHGLGIEYGSASPQPQSQPQPQPQAQVAMVNPSLESKPPKSTTTTIASMVASNENQDRQAPDDNKLLSPVREVLTPTPSSAQKSMTATPTKASLASMYPIQDIPPFKGKKKRNSPEAKPMAKSIIAEIPPFRGKPSAPSKQLNQEIRPVENTVAPSSPVKMNGNSPNNLSYAERVARGANLGNAFVAQHASRQQQQPNGIGSSLTNISNSAKQMSKGYPPSYEDRANPGNAPSEARTTLGPNPLDALQSSPKSSAPGLASEWQQSISKKHKRNKSRNANGQLGSQEERKGG